ncbi:helix-turn-helix transcriptional regulator [Mucilaginibacter flavus]|uniref:helix-turn-helix transcriptional regulator n=1 Tax=Mucilaginibacter flavus TaxID=931504 RepID=UPI0025B5EB13|nr:response regulator transcription factor [Mucilaginibacter flavus]MDN3584599.1 helix-turn-helix transcriptional regulator [Mucilaginibacter flavus]
MNKPLLVEEITSTTDSFDIRVSTRFGAGNGPGKHEHEHPSLVFILSGGCAEKRQCGNYERRAADLTYLHAGEAHETIFTSIPTRYLSLDIKPTALSENNIREERLINAIHQSPDAKFLILKMYREMLHNDAHSTDSIHMLFYQLICTSQTIHKKKIPAWITIVQEILHDRWNETITLLELSQVSGVNPITISKHFSSFFGCTLGDYLRKQKVERSLSLIKHTATPLTQIAYLCNFSDQSHFIRNFRNYTSLTPKQYQKL